MRWLQVHTRTSQTASLLGSHRAPARGWASRREAYAGVRLSRTCPAPARPSALGPQGACRAREGTPAFTKRDFLQGSRVPLGRAGHGAWVPSLRILSQTTHPQSQLAEVPFLTAVPSAVSCDSGQIASHYPCISWQRGRFLKSRL